MLGGGGFKAAMSLGTAKWPAQQRGKHKHRGIIALNKALNKAEFIQLPYYREDLDPRQLSYEEWGYAEWDNGSSLYIETEEDLKEKKAKLMAEKKLRFPKIETCGPSCDVCCYPVTGTPYRKGSKNFHIECFTCNFCFEAYTFRRKFVLPNGFHVSCSPCIGCCRPFDHQSKSGYCSTRCASKAPIIDIVAISAKRKGIYIPKNLLKEIYKFLYKLVAVEIQSLSEETLSIISQAERRLGIH